MNILCLVFNTRYKMNADLQRHDGGKLQNLNLWVQLPLKHPPKTPVQLQKPPVTKSFLESDENSLGTRKYGFVCPWTNKTLCIWRQNYGPSIIGEHADMKKTPETCAYSSYTDISLYWFLKATSPFQSISEVCIKDQTSLCSSVRHAYNKEWSGVKESSADAPHETS